MAEDAALVLGCFKPGKSDNCRPSVGFATAAEFQFHAPGSDGDFMPAETYRGVLVVKVQLRADNFSNRDWQQRMIRSGIH